MKRNKITLFVVVLLSLVMVLSVACTKPAATDPTKAPDTATKAPDAATAAPTVDPNLDPNFNPTGYPIVKESVTLGIFGSRSVNSPEDFNELWIIQKASETTGIKFDWATTPGGAAYDEKKSIMLASGDYPEIMAHTVNDIELAKYGAEGVFIPLEDLMDKYAPNLQALYDEKPLLKAYNTAPDGHQYGFPQLNEGGWMQSGNMLIYNKKWLENLNIAAPTTLDEFKAMLVAFKEKDANGDGDATNETPLSFFPQLTGRGGQGVTTLIGSFGTVAPNNYRDVKDGKVEWVGARDEWKAAVKWFRDLYSEGLIEPDAFTMIWDQYAAAFNEVPYKVGVFPIWEIGDGFSNPLGAEEYDFLTPLKQQDGSDPVVFVNDMPGYARGRWVITKNVVSPEIAVRMGDYFFEKDVSLTMIEGAIDGPLPRLVPCTVCNNGRALMVNPETPEGMTILMFRDNSCIAGCTAWGVTRAYYDERLHLHFTDRKVNFIDTVLKPLQDKEDCPALFYSAEEAEIVNQIQQELIEYTDKRAAEWVMNKSDIDADWTAYLAELEQMRLPELLELSQAAYDRFKSGK